MSTKEVDVSLDLEELTTRIEDAREAQLVKPSNKSTNVRTTVMSLGKDPRISTTPEVSPPTIRFIEFMTDGLDNPLVKLHWRITRSDIDRAGVVGFKIFRRLINTKKFLRQIRRGDEAIVPFGALGFSQISRKMPARGKFGAENKARFQINSALIPANFLNPNLNLFETIARSRNISSFSAPKSLFAKKNNAFFDSGLPIFNQSSFLRYTDHLRWKQIGYVDYSSFVAKEKRSFVFVQEREFVDMDFKDKTVQYGDTYEYYIVSVSESLKDSANSESIKIFVENPKPVRPPVQLLIKQLEATKIRVSVFVDKRDSVKRALVFRRDEKQIEFEQIASLTNVDDCINFIDSNLEYGRSYTYRVFLENIYGVISDPKEVVYTISRQNVISKTRSNTLKIPILNAIADQNSDSIKLTIASNDPRVAYYEVDRRNLTIHEKRFSVPSRESGYGGVGWDTNKLFVIKQRVPKAFTPKKNAFGFFRTNPFLKQRNLTNPLKSSFIRKRRPTQLLNRRIKKDSLEFVDDTVQVGHVYQYRVVGKDLYGNSSSHQVFTLRATGKKRIRSPIDLRIEVLRESPLRIKLVWSDDNETNRYSFNELFKVNNDLNPDNSKFIYQIQRREDGETVYQTFPFTANKYLIDEVASDDSADFFQKQQQDIFRSLPNKEVNEELKRNQRPFNFPSFLEKNKFYYYRVKVLDQERNESNYTEEIEVLTAEALSEVIDFKVEVLNVKVKPLSARLTWKVESNKRRPDRYVIERKFDTETDTFERVGVVYLSELFVDKSIELGNSYIYRIRGLDNIGGETDYAEARLTL